MHVLPFIRLLPTVLILGTNRITLGEPSPSKLGNIMNRNNTTKHNPSVTQPRVTSQRTLENILDEYKIISVKLFKYSDQVQETEEQWETVAVEQALLLDAQQALLIEAQTMKIENGKDVFALLELWKADEIYNNQATPSQGIVLHLRDYFKKKVA